MKYVLLLVFLVGFALSEITEEQKQLLRRYRSECLTSTGADVDIQKKARQGNFSEDSESKKFWLCINQKVGFQTANGDIVRDVVLTKNRSIVGSEKAQKIADNCAKQKSTPEETALAYAKCAHTYLRS